MEFCHLQEYFEAARCYSYIATMKDYNVSDGDISAVVARLHDAMTRIDVKGLANLLKQHYANIVFAETLIRRWLDYISFLRWQIIDNYQAFRKVDTKLEQTVCFTALIFNALCDIWDEIKRKVAYNRILEDNEKALDFYKAFKLGFFNCGFRKALARHIISDCYPEEALRRVRYIAAHCPDEDKEYIAGCANEIEHLMSKHDGVLSWEKVRQAIMITFLNED